MYGAPTAGFKSRHASMYRARTDGFKRVPGAITWPVISMPPA
jgi:hypothetical protein